MEPIQETEDILGTPIQEFFRGKNVLITGGTGFMGKVLTEKLLRSCPHIAQIYLLVRSKKDKNAQQRMDELLDDPLFDRVSPKIRNKLEAISGDCSLPGLGISEHDRNLLKEKINIIIHAAATVRFDEALRLAVAINVTGTREILSLAREVADLKAIVHVSTAFANCHLKEINETFYDPAIRSENLIQLTECLDDKILDKITPVLLEDRPNTYVYTKSVAEDLVRKESKGLPLAIFRPAIVVATNSEPIPGWIDNMYGATGVVVGCGTGVLRTLQCDKTVVANIVPVDMACNAIIACAWDAAQRKVIDTNHNKKDKEDEQEMPKEPPIYNYVSSVEKPINWAMFLELAFKHGLKTPPMNILWYFCLTLHTSVIMHKLSVIFLHFLPAILIDFAAKLVGKKTDMLKIYKKINKFSDVIAYFGMRNWNFDNSNVQNLWKSLDQRDQEIFPFSMAQMHWDTYFYHYVRGVRKYLLKEDPSTIPQALSKLRRFYWLHQGVKCLFGFCFLRLAWLTITTIASIAV